MVSAAQSSVENMASAQCSSPSDTARIHAETWSAMLLVRKSQPATMRLCTPVLLVLLLYTQTLIIDSHFPSGSQSQGTASFQSESAARGASQEGIMAVPMLF